LFDRWNRDIRNNDDSSYRYYGGAEYNDDDNDDNDDNVAPVTATRAMCHWHRILVDECF